MQEIYFEECKTALCLDQGRRSRSSSIFTWAYLKDSLAWADMGMNYDAMAQELHDTYREVADLSNVLIAEVGQ